MCILVNMKTLPQLLLAQKLIFSKCVLFQNNLLPSDTVPLRKEEGLHDNGGGGRGMKLGSVSFPRRILLFPGGAFSTV